MSKTPELIHDAPRRRRVPRVVWLFAFGLLSLALTASAQSRDSQTPIFGETVDVRVVNIEVVVTDKQGNLVTGLDASDFELRLDGEPVPIEYFSEIDEGVLRPVDAEAGADGSTVAAPGGLRAGEAVATSYLVFIDEFFSTTRDRDRMIEHLVEQVPQMREQDRMAVVRYDGKQLERLSGWTRGAELQNALRRATRQRSQGLRRLMEQRPAFRPSELDELQRQRANEESRLTLEEQFMVERLEDQLERVVRAAVSTLRSFPAPSGRKTMLLLAGGWPFDPVEYIVDDFSRIHFESAKNRFGDLYDPLRDTANLLGYTLYPVDVPGFQATAISADTGSQSRVQVSTPTETFFREAGLHRSLEYLATETGGKAILNAGRDQLLETVIDDTRSYYWLGFSPQRTGDDQRHDIEVLVNRPGLKVRSRGDFFDFSRQREVTLAVESALYFGSPPSENPLVVKLGKGRRTGLRSSELPLDLLIPADELTILPGPGGYVGQVELRVAVLDEDGATTDTPVIPLNLTLAEKPTEGAMLSYSTKLKVRRKKQTIVVAIYDVPTGAILSSSVEVEP